MNSFKVTESDILLIIKSLNSTKPRRYDKMISIRMIKLCSELITLPLKINFQESPKKRKLTEMWKKANVVPVHKKRRQNSYNKLASPD